MVDPTISALENEIYGEKSDELNEIVLRAKLKYLSMLKWFFDNMFKQL